MLISELQEVPEEPMNHVYDIITSITNQWKDGRTDEASYHSQLAHLYSVTHDADKCRQHAALVPDDARDIEKAEAFVALARILVFEHKISEAVVYYEDAIRVDPGHDVALEELGWCHLELKNYEAAEPCFRRAIDETPDFFLVWEGLGLAASHLEKYEEAISYFTQAMQLETSGTYNYYYEYMIGLCYSHLKDFYRALAHYTKCLDANPSYGHALNNMATLYFEHEADIKTAIVYLKKAEAIGEEKEDSQLLQLVYINLMRLYSVVKEFNLKAMYKTKLFDILGFGGGMNEDE